MRSVEVSSSSEVRHTRREGEELGGHRVARVGGMPSSQVASQRGRRSGVGWRGQRVISKPSLQRLLVASSTASNRASHLLALLESFVASFAGKTLDGSLNGFFWRILRSREFHVCDPRHVRTFFFFDCRVLQGDCPKSPSFTGPVTVR